MSIKRGDIVSHSEAMSWGVGKVVEATTQRISIQFNDGVIRKIACSHFQNLKRAEPALFLPIPAAVPKAATKAASPRQKKVKL